MADAYPYQPVIRLPKPKIHPANKQNVLRFGICEPKDFLVADTLFFDGLPSSIKEADIRALLQHCMPIECVSPKNISQETKFPFDVADRAFSLYNGFTFTNGAKLQLRMYQDSSLEPEAQANLLQIKNLPLHIDDNNLYDIFRPYGALNLCKSIMEGSTFQGTAFIQFFSQEDADKAQKILHGKILDGNVISVTQFVPTANCAPIGTMASAEGDKTETGYVDFMNLYIKNLDPSITNNDLFALFRGFGRIVSARVMSNPATGQSKGYGFVSYGKPEEAAMARQAMNGTMVLSKQLIVAYHEPKRQRHDPQKSTSNAIPQHPTNGTVTNGSSTNGVSANGNMHPSDKHTHDVTHSPFRSYGDHSQPHEHADSNTANVKDLSIGQKPTSPMQFTSRKVSAVESHHLHTNARLSPPFSSSPNSGISTGPSLVSLASGFSVQVPPNVPSQNQTNKVGDHRPTLRRRGSMESVASVMTESSIGLQRQKLTDAVLQCGNFGDAVPEIVDMLWTLKRKERSLCLFNPDFLRSKIQLALDALATFGEESEEEEIQVQPTSRRGLCSSSSHRASMVSTSVPPASVPYTISSASNRVSVKPPSKAIPIVDPRTSSGSQSDTTTDLVQKVKLPEATQTEVNRLLSSLEGKPVHEQKQQLGDQLFPLVKATGVKHAPKITIRLLDTLDLRELAHIMHCKPILKEKVDEALAAMQK
ncbi:uncharacterized protein BYT42DRAFT_546237 [Radiomyces spectabilis]|uniref:uncharacterized protein n=1 Tax=Radiomyces spectabilis TaxID=64574 RepID=UPI0022211246|nr:uncharacterized protein BYT42DRAFT_546237 [Radiomyces spectabilis]KAI8377560.1 hypothetical protein BYT42DRAFT_546237 [Radiomyces spectabilis]